MTDGTRDAARVRLLDATQAPLAVRNRFARGDPGPIIASLAHVPELLKVGVPFFNEALAGVTVPPRTAELVIVRASAQLRCTYCTLTHAAAALSAGIDAKELRVLCDATSPASAAAEDEREAILLAWVDEVAAGRGDVPDEIAEAMASAYDEATIVELAMMLGCTILLNRYCTALRLPVGAGSLGIIAAAGIEPEELLA